MTGIRIEKLCGGSVWLRTHVKFCRSGDIIRINNCKDKVYKCVSNPVWSDVHKEWDIKFILWDTEKDDS